MLRYGYRKLIMKNHMNNLQNQHIMRTKLLTIKLGLLIFLMGTSCTSDSPLDPNNNCGSASWSEEVQNELDALVTATEAFQQDPTTSSCTTYVQASRNYLDALEDLRLCVPNSSQAAFDQAVVEAKNTLDNADCSDL